jgi:hypothetical protein
VQLQFTNPDALESSPHLSCLAGKFLISVGKCPNLRRAAAPISTNDCCQPRTAIISVNPAFSFLDSLEIS